LVGDARGRGRAPAPHPPRARGGRAPRGHALRAPPRRADARRAAARAAGRAARGVRRGRAGARPAGGVAGTDVTAPGGEGGSAPTSLGWTDAAARSTFGVLCTHNVTRRHLEVLPSDVCV